MTEQSIGALALALVNKSSGDVFTGVARSSSFVPDFFERFFERYIEEPMTGCWIWLGSRGKAGYGNFTLDRRVYYAHRTAYEATHGEGSSIGYIVRHRCDLRCCVNPGHLVEGLPIDNVEDAWRRNRMNPARGEASGAAVLTEAEVALARSLAAHGTPVNDVAASLGIARNTIESAITGRTWSHISGALSRAELTHSPMHQNHIKGEGHYKSRLTTEQVSAIRTRVARGERGIDLAAEYGVAKSTITAIKTGQNRRHG
ncbi:HNH endonuclease [Rhizobium puerariae]|uniref:HNH endonuclease n=1 Tax=Rhizobium puerariae TaxID=1585791 RepID=A0ABV6AN86_9HYPH